MELSHFVKLAKITADSFGFVCHDCKKEYGFSDVNYKDEKYS